MKKTGFVAAIAALSAAAGALAVGALYLRRREKELDEYEDLLFGDEVAPEEEQEVEIAIEPEQVWQNPQKLPLRRHLQKNLLSNVEICRRLPAYP